MHLTHHSNLYSRTDVCESDASCLREVKAGQRWQRRIQSLRLQYEVISCEQSKLLDQAGV